MATATRSATAKSTWRSRKRTKAPRLVRGGDDGQSPLEPFVRLEGSRNRATGGAGLGLAIVRTLAEAHGGGIIIQDAPMGGARFVVRLPMLKVGS